MFTEDLSAFFDTAGFATSASWTPAAGGGPFTLAVIVENGYNENQIGDANVAGREVMVWARDDKLAQGTGIKRNDTITINAIGYKVAEIKPDGTGVSLLNLRV